MQLSIYAIEPGALILLLFVLLAKYSLRQSPSLRLRIASDQSSPSFIPQLEGLRGLLATAVVVYHAVLIFIAFPRNNIWAAIPSNAYEQLAVASVLMFFFLTGFLFWSKLLRSPRLLPGPYFRARLRRLLPVYLFAMLGLFLLVAVETHLHRRSSVTMLSRSLLAWLFFTLPGMPDINGLPATAHLIAGTPWTLAMEWRFYLLLPLLTWFAQKAHRCLYLLPPALLAYFACSDQVLHRLHLVFGSGVATLCSSIHATAGHLVWSFGVGIAVASLRAACKWPESPRWSPDSSLVSVTCVVTIAIVIFYLTPHYLSTTESLLLGFAFFCIASGNTLWGLLSSAPMLLLGRCSFSMYLLHGLVLSGIAWTLQIAPGGRLLSGMKSWSLIAACVPIIFALSVGVHILVEAPWMAPRRHTRQSTGLPAMPPASTLSTDESFGRSPGEVDQP